MSDQTGQNIPYERSDIPFMSAQTWQNIPYERSDTSL
jgi:hypothetical protein